MSQRTLAVACQWVDALPWYSAAALQSTTTDVYVTEQTMQQRRWTSSKLSESIHFNKRQQTTPQLTSKVTRSNVNGCILGHVTDIQTPTLQDHWLQMLRLMHSTPHALERVYIPSDCELVAVCKVTHKKHHTVKWVCRGLTSHSTLYRSFRGRFLHAGRPNQQCQSTEGSQLATEISFNTSRITQQCYRMNSRQPSLG